MFESFVLLAEEAAEPAADLAAAMNNEVANFGIAEYLFSGFGLLIISLIFVLPLFLAAIPANIAKKKGRNFAGYYLFGYFALIPAIIVTLIQKPVPVETKVQKSMREKAGKK